MSNTHIKLIFLKKFQIYENFGRVSYIFFIVAKVVLKMYVHIYFNNRPFPYNPTTQITEMAIRYINLLVLLLLEVRVCNLVRCYFTVIIRTVLKRTELKCRVPFFFFFLDDTHLTIIVIFRNLFM